MITFSNNLARPLVIVPRHPVDQELQVDSIHMFWGVGFTPNIQPCAIIRSNCFDTKPRCVMLRLVFGEYEQG